MTASTSSRRFTNLSPPVCPRRARTETRHGITRTDEYHWLRAENWQEVFRDESLLPADIRAYLEAENAYQEVMLADAKKLQATLVQEMRGRIKEEDASVPLRDGPWAYGTAYVAGGQHPRFIRRPAEGGADEVLLDGDREAEGKAYFRFGAVEHAADHTHLVWGSDDNGSEYFTLRARDLGTGTDLPDQVARTGGHGAWSKDRTGFFYAWLDDNHRPVQVLYHALGTPVSEDRVIYEETDPAFFISLGSTRDHEWLLIRLGHHETDEIRLLPLGEPSSAPRIVEPRQEGVQYSLEQGGDVFFVLTNADDAKDFKIMTAPVEAPARENWVELVPQVPGRLILSILSFKDFLVRLDREDGLPRIVVRDRASGEEHVITFAEEACSLGLGSSHEYDTELMRFTYSSMTTPNQEFEYDLRTREKVLLKAQEVPSGHEPSDYVTRRLMASSHDGELVPVSVLYRKDTPLDGSAPCLLYGYGAYGISMPASFSTDRLSLVDRGFVYAIAHIRGGKDKGYGWYEDGKREKKENTFHDFIAAGRHLVREGLTSHDRIVAQGGSAGGMLMGAIANMAPEDFAAVVAQVPFVDVLNTMLDDALPLTPSEWPEWGNPIISEEDYRRIAGYSPYDNVGARPYPAIFAIAGLTDPQVTYWEPAK